MSGSTLNRHGTGNGRIATPGLRGRQTGLTLIELLIAMVLGLTLATGVIQIYVGNNTTERDREARLRMQEGGRFALNYLAQEMRMAGYLGCIGSIMGETVNNTLDAPDATFQPGFSVQGWEAAGTDPGDINNSVENVALVDTDTAEWTTSNANFQIPDIEAVPNSDIIRVWGATGSAGTVTSITQGTPPTFDAQTAVGIQADDFLIISDCEQADFVQACTVVDNAPATTSTITVGTTCNPGNVADAVISSQTTITNLAEVIRLRGTMFYVGKRDDDATNTPSLFMRQLDDDTTIGAAQELVEGVESMQILYGVNIDQDVRNTVDAYVPADQVPEWNEVISIRVSLLMISPEDGTVPAPQAYAFDGVTYDGTGGTSLPTDNRARRVFVSTLSLRNRALGV